jgi:uncharacterized membrane protein YfcA
MHPLSRNEIAYLCIVTVLGISLRGGTGFGAAAAMPLMGVVVPMRVLAAVWTVLNLCGAAIILRREHGNVAWVVLRHLLPTCVLGVAIGLGFYGALDSPALACGLGALVVLYGGFALRASMRPQPDEKPSIWRNARLAHMRILNQRRHKFFHGLKNRNRLNSFFPRLIIPE